MDLLPFPTFLQKELLQSLNGIENHLSPWVVTWKTHPLFLVGERIYYYWSSMEQYNNDSIVEYWRINWMVKKVTRTCFINLVGVENITTRTVNLWGSPLLENHFLVSLNFVITNFYLHQLWVVIIIWWWWILGVVHEIALLQVHSIGELFVG